MMLINMIFYTALLRDLLKGRRYISGIYKSLFPSSRYLESA